MWFKLKFAKAPDPMKVYNLCYWIYVCTGFWKYNSPKRWVTKSYKVYQGVVFTIYIVSLTLFVIDGVMVRNDFDKLSFNLSSSFLAILNASKFGFLMRESDNLEKVHDKLNNHLDVETVGKSEEDRIIFRKKAVTLSFLMVLFYCLLCTGMPFKVAADTALDLRLYLIPMPYRDQLEPYYEIIYYQQVFLVFHFLLTVLTHDLLVMGVLLRFVGHFEVLEKNFLQLKTIYPTPNYEKYVCGYKDTSGKSIASGAVDGRPISICSCVFPDTNASSKAERERKTFKLLQESIYHHQIILQEIKNFSQLYSKPLLVQACGVGFLIGIVVTQIFFLARQLNALLIQQVMYVVTTLWNIFYLCSFADDLSQKSLAAADALYDTPWYEMSVKNGQLVLFSLKKLMVGPMLKGGGMIPLNRLTYLKFLQVSYNLIAVLRHMYQKNVPQKEMTFI